MANCLLTICTQQLYLPLAVVRVAVVVLVAGDVAVVWDVLIDVVEAFVVLVDIVVEFEGSSFAVKYGKFKLDLILIDYKRRN